MRNVHSLSKLNGSPPSMTRGKLKINGPSISTVFVGVMATSCCIDGRGTLNCRRCVRFPVSPSITPTVIVVCPSCSPLSATRLYPM